MTRSEHIRALMEEYARQRAADEDALDARIAEAEGRDPEIARLRQDNVSLALNTMRNILSLPTQEARAAAAEDMRRRGVANNAELRRRLKALGLQEDYLEMQYLCQVCRDTGYVGEPVHEQCACLRRAVMNSLYQSEGLQGLEHQNFERFDEGVFPDEPRPGLHTQREDARRLREIGEQYADAFSPGDGRGLLLFGKTGLGKTFLMNCVAQRVLERGYSVAVVSAYKLVEIMRAYQFSGEGADRVQDFLTCDLLCIDDLGSEPMIRSVTVSAIYHIVSERCSAGRALVVTTNCDVAQLYERYDERVAARLCDQGRMKVLPFTGADVRRFAAQRGGRA